MSHCPATAFSWQQMMIQYNKYVLALAVILTLMLSSCHGGGERQGHFPFLDALGITVDETLMLGDTLRLPDIYCGDDSQENKINGVELTQDQYRALIVPAGYLFADEMSLWTLLGVRDACDGKTLAVFHSGNNVGYCVMLATYDAEGRILDAINARELHLVWRADLSAPDDDRSFVLDGFFTFDMNHLTLHRTMSECIMDYDKDLKGAPKWHQAWEQDYFINDKGYFMLQQPHVTSESGPIDYYAAMDLKSWDLLVCSLHDPGVMDVWNNFVPLMKETYAPDYPYNPFPWDVTQLYRMNPQRFLRWMAARRHEDNNLLPYFKLVPGDRPDLLAEIGRIDDDDARQWLTALVNSWDDKPLTQVYKKKKENH